MSVNATLHNMQTTINNALTNPLTPPQAVQSGNLGQDLMTALQDAMDWAVNSGQQAYNGYQAQKSLNDAMDALRQGDLSTAFTEAMDWAAHTQAQLQHGQIANGHAQSFGQVAQNIINSTPPGMQHFLNNQGLNTAGLGTQATQVMTTTQNFVMNHIP